MLVLCIGERAHPCLHVLCGADAVEESTRKARELLAWTQLLSAVAGGTPLVSRISRRIQQDFVHLTPPLGFGCLCRVARQALASRLSLFWLHFVGG